jgi:hypothetical protein
MNIDWNVIKAGKEEERAMFQQMQAMAQKQVSQKQPLVYRNNKKYLSFTEEEQRNVNAYYFY